MSIIIGSGAVVGPDACRRSRTAQGAAPLRSRPGMLRRPTSRCGPGRRVRSTSSIGRPLASRRHRSRRRPNQCQARSGLARAPRQRDSFTSICKGRLWAGLEFGEYFLGVLTEAGRDGAGSPRRAVEVRGRRDHRHAGVVLRAHRSRHPRRGTVRRRRHPPSS